MGGEILMGDGDFVQITDLMYCFINNKSHLVYLGPVLNLESPVV